MRRCFIGNLLEATCAGELILSLSKSLPLIVGCLQKKAQIWAWWHILYSQHLGGRSGSSEVILCYEVGGLI